MEKKRGKRQREFSVKLLNPDHTSCKQRNGRHIQSVPETPETSETPHGQTVTENSEVTDGPSLETDLTTDSRNGSSTPASITPHTHTPTCKITLAGGEVKQPIKFKDYVLG